MNFLSNRKNRTITVVCLLIAAICAFLIQDDSLFKMITSASSQSIGILEQVKKDVRKKNIANYFWEDVGRGDNLNAGDSIFTGSESSVIVKLEGGQTITVAPNSLIKFRTKNQKLVIDIPYGAVQMDEVLEDIIISDCGRDYSVSQQKGAINFNKSEKCGSVAVDTKSEVAVKEFKAQKLSKDIAESFLEIANQGILDNLERSVASEEAGPVLSLQPPQFDSLNIRYSAINGADQVLKWNPDAQAESYEIEISNTPDFQNIEKFNPTTTQLSLSRLAKNVFFRGRSIGKDSQLSDYSEVGQIQVDFPGIKIKNPKLNKEYRAKNPYDRGTKEKFDVAWSKVPLADKYVVEVKDPKSAKTIKKYDSRSPASVIEVPKPGKYSYQIHALDAEGRKISSSDVGQVTYDKVFTLEAPVIVGETSNKFYFFQKDSGKYVWLNWTSSGEENRFRVEIARDKEFTQVVKSVFTTRNKLLITDQVEGGEYFWRVRKEDKDEFSNWSNVDVFKVQINEDNLERIPAQE